MSQELTTAAPTSDPHLPKRTPQPLLVSEETYLVPCSRLAETLSTIESKLLFLNLPFNRPGRENPEFSFDEGQAICMEIGLLRNLVQIAREQASEEFAVWRGK